MRRWLLLAFLTTIAVDWPQHFRFNIRVTDAALIAAASAILGTVRSWAMPRLRLLDIAIVIYLAGSTVSVVFSPDPRTSSVELIKHFYVASIYAIVALAVRQGFATTVATGLALSGAVLAVVGLIAALVRTTTGYGFTALTPVTALPYIGEIVRIRALTLSESMFASVLAVSLPFTVLHPVVQQSRRRTLGVAALFGAAAALTFSHSIAGVAVAALIVAWPYLRSRLVRIGATAATVLVVLAFNFAATVAIRSIGATGLRDDTVFQYGIDRGRVEIAGVNVDYQTMSYFRIKEVALDAFRSRPLVGIGFEQFHAVTETAFQQGRLTAPYRAIDPHSTFIGRLAEAGVVGFITLMVLWIAIGRETAELLQISKDWMAIAAAAAVAGTLINTMNADVMNFRFLWVALGLVRGRLPERAT